MKSFSLKTLALVVFVMVMYGTAANHIRLLMNYPGYTYGFTFFSAAMRNIAIAQTVLLLSRLNIWSLGNIKPRAKMFFSYSIFTLLGIIAAESTLSTVAVVELSHVVRAISTFMAVILTITSILGYLYYSPSKLVSSQKAKTKNGKSHAQRLSHLSIEGKTIQVDVETAAQLEAWLTENGYTEQDQS